MNPYVEVLGQVRKPKYGSEKKTELRGSEKKNHRTRFHGFHVDFGFQIGFLDFKVDFWISSRFPTVYEISIVMDPLRGV